VDQRSILVVPDASGGSVYLYRPTDCTHSPENVRHNRDVHTQCSYSMSQFSRFGLRGRRVEVVKGSLLPFELRELGDLPRSRVPKTLLNSKVLLNCGNVAMKSCARRHDYKADDRTPSTA
jgi:hypothetical protein